MRTQLSERMGLDQLFTVAGEKLRHCGRYNIKKPCKGTPDIKNRV